MNVNVETILSVFAVISGFGAVLLFLNTGLFGSPVTIGLGILSFSGIVFNLTYNSDDRAIHLVGITIFSLGFIISMTYPVLSILSDTTGVAIVLSLISVFFLLLNRLIRDDNINKKYIKYISVVVIIIFVIFAFVDVTTGKPTVKNVEPLESPQVSDQPDEYNIAELTIYSTLPKQISRDDNKNYAACLPNHNLTKIDEEMDLKNLDKDEKIVRVQTQYDNYNGEMIFGSESKDLYMNVPPVYDSNEIESSKIVMSDDCNPEEYDNKVIIIYEVSNNFHPPRPY